MNPFWLVTTVAVICVGLSCIAIGFSLGSKFYAYRADWWRNCWQQMRIERDQLKRELRANE